VDEDHSMTCRPL